MSVTPEQEFAMPQDVMDTLTKLKRRVKQLERCLRDVREMTTEREEIFLRDMPDALQDCDDYLVLRDITNRINRTL